MRRSAKTTATFGNFYVLMGGGRRVRCAGELVGKEKEYFNHNVNQKSDKELVKVTKKMKK